MGSGLRKINILYKSAEEAFLDNPEAEWIPHHYNPQRDLQFLLEVEKWRQEGRQLKVEIEEINKKNS